MPQEPNKALTEGLDIRQTAKQTNLAKSLSSNVEHSFSISSDQTLKNTMAAKGLLKRQ
ncbi:hypothetical protein R83H12_01675 [Fibrobacteria bacterium R8-3-H12]